MSYSFSGLPPWPEFIQGPVLRGALYLGMNTPYSLEFLAILVLNLHFEVKFDKIKEHTPISERLSSTICLPLTASLCDALGPDHSPQPRTAGTKAHQPMMSWCTAVTAHFLCLQPHEHSLGPSAWERLLPTPDLGME